MRENGDASKELKSIMESSGKAISVSGYSRGSLKSKHAASCAFMSKDPTLSDAAGNPPKSRSKCMLPRSPSKKSLVRRMSSPRSISFISERGGAIVLPDNIFGSKDNETLRRWIYDTCRIVGVVGIPRNAFMPHTAVKTSILFLQKRDLQRNSSEEIFFGISELPGKDSRGNLLFKDDSSKTWKNVYHDLDQIAVEFKEFLRNKGIGW